MDGMDIESKITHFTFCIQPVSMTGIPACSPFTVYNEHQCQSLLKFFPLWPTWNFFKSKIPGHSSPPRKAKMSLSPGSCTWQDSKKVRDIGPHVQSQAIPRSLGKSCGQKSNPLQANLTFLDFPSVCTKYVPRPRDGCPSSHWSSMHMLSTLTDFTIF